MVANLAGQNPSGGGESLPVVGQNTQSAGQPPPNQQQQQVVNGGARTRPKCGSKPPKYTADGGFDLYRAQIEGYLIQHECWDGIGGTAAANPNDPQWTERN
ncbi:hypothetical protein ON010_g6473 [Phytophthora cinnamomi]|nr:hypothetical protein ON010_g6473 [Phytophthora cinnamomi]